MKVLCHDPTAAYCSAAGTTSPEFTACKARPSLAHPATKGKALSFAKTVSAADLAASWWTHGSPGSHAAACFRRDEIGGEFSPEIVAQVKLIALLEADRWEQQTAGCAGSHLTADLVGQLPRSGYEVVVNVGLEGVDDASAVVGCDLDVLVYIPGRVDYDASPRLLRPDHIAIVGQALDSYCSTNIGDHLYRGIRVGTTCVRRDETLYYAYCKPPET